MSDKKSGNPKTPSDPPLCFADVLTGEVREILRYDITEQRAVPAGGDPTDIADPDSPERDYERRVQNAVDDCGTDLAALCLSGGGIRSATFALGVMQGLARYGLLNKFHYLSSVSGGGYIASWLTTWRSLEKDSVINEALNASMETGAEPPEITGIRADSNYLTPKLGLLSADTWTVVALYIRNLLLNWILFVPFFMGCFLLPRACASVLLLLRGSLDPLVAFEWGCAEGVGLLVVALGVGIFGRFVKAGAWLTERRFLGYVLLALVLSGAFFTVAAVSGGCSGRSLAGWTKHSLVQWAPWLTSWTPRTVMGAAGAAIGSGAYFVAWVLGRFLSRPHTSPAERHIEWLDVFFWSLSGAVVGELAVVGINLIARNVHHGVLHGVCTLVANDYTPSRDTAVNLATVAGLSGFVLAYLVGELVYVGLASFSQKADMDREWLARSSGYLVATAVGWGLFSAISLLSPQPLQAAWAWAVTAMGSVVSGFITGKLGWSNVTSATTAGQKLKNVSPMRLASVAAVIFALLISALLSLLDQNMEALMTAPHVLLSWLPGRSNEARTFCADVALMLILIAVAAGLSFFINVNRFSMHALYRNRLVRAFLGSARARAADPGTHPPKRKSDPFTGFDPFDNVHLADLQSRTASEHPVHGERLFHVINASLNVVSSRRLAWQERKAESFTMSRLFCGNPYVGYRYTREYGGHTKGGLTLGTAMAISGAAVSPNMGYNSSSLIAFLLMLFNVRLGWWLGSPRYGRDSRREAPTFSLTPALKELAGDTTDRSKWIYLSDGGHFENLGLYEMVRRRCRKIVVSDAACDPDCNFEDLGNAVRKIFIDFGVSIEFKQLEIKPRKNPPTPGLRFAIGSISYPGSKRPGWLLYLKPTYQDSIPRVDVRSYAAAHATFPHESTVDQWFSESQLESYRALGANIAEYVCSGGKGGAPTDLNLDELHTVASELLDLDLKRLQPGWVAQPEKGPVTPLKRRYRTSGITR